MENERGRWHFGVSAAVSATRGRGGVWRARRSRGVVVVVDVPELPFFPRDKLRSIMIKNESGQTASLAKSSVVNRQSQLRAGIAQLKIAHPALLIYDPMEFLCDDTACHLVIDEVLIYYSLNLLCWHILSF